MKAMILAAGKGERMRPLTDATPKPLLQAGGKALLEHWLVKLDALANIDEVIINTAYLGEQIQRFVESRNGVKVRISDEGEPLETGGAIRKAAPLLGDEPFLLINGDVYCDVDLAEFSQAKVMVGGAHLLLVDNPAHNAKGDFMLAGSRVSLRERDGEIEVNGSEGLASGDKTQTKTFAGISIISPALIASHPAAENFPLREPLLKAVASGQVTASLHTGYWQDVGTPARLAELDTYLARA